MAALPWFLSKRPPLKPGELTMLDRLERIWRIRPCWICEARGFCHHREVEVDAALVERGRAA